MKTQNERNMEKSTINQATVNNYSSEYSDASFWSKIFKSAGKAGKKVVSLALELYYAYTDGALTGWQKAQVLAALGYLICPFDIVPDAIPLLGFADDLAALKLAYDTVESAITDEIKEKARRKCESIFG